MHLDPGVIQGKHFYPIRFSPEEKARRDPYDHIPFGYGPRNCIAMRLALMEIIMSAALVLKHFTFVRCEKTKVSQWSQFSYWYLYNIYRKVSNIRRTKSQNLNASRLIL